MENLIEKNMSDHVRENIFVQMKFILQTILDIETRRGTYKHISKIHTSTRLLTAFSWRGFGSLSKNYL